MADEWFSFLFLMLFQLILPYVVVADYLQILCG